jgi:Family of unknown function (DUF6328)
MIVEPDCTLTPRGKARHVTDDQQLASPGQEGQTAEARAETPLERYDRNLTELMGELRVALPGVQVLFGFLLVIPFDNRFKGATGAERGLYFATLVLTLLASMLLIAPTMVHRLTFRQGQKDYIVLVGNRLAIAGLTVLATALTCAIVFVTAFVFGPVAAILTGILAAAAFVLLWYVLALGHLHGVS